MSSSETRFLDEKLQTFGQFWAESKVNATLNAWALINNLRTFLPDAKLPVAVAVQQRLSLIV